MYGLRLKTRGGGIDIREGFTIPSWWIISISIVTVKTEKREEGEEGEIGEIGKIGEERINISISISLSISLHEYSPALEGREEQCLDYDYNYEISGGMEGGKEGRKEV